MSEEICPYCGKTQKKVRCYDELKKYWAVLRDVAEQTEIEGRKYAPWVWHEQFKRQFIGCVDLPNGQTVGISTANYDDKEMRAYRWQVEEYVQREFGVMLTVNIEPIGRIA